MERPEAERELIPQIADRMRGRVGFEDAKLSVRQLARIEAATADESDLVPAGDLVEQLRAVKEPGELEAIAASAELSDGVYRWAIERGLAGKTEREVARACEARIRSLARSRRSRRSWRARRTGRCRTPSLASARSDLVSLVVFDMGAELDGYCSDCTRTYATGDPGDEAREFYELVLRAQKAALDAIRPGAGGKEVDAVPRG